MLKRLPLAHLPTPLFHSARLDALLGCEVWIKRDDMTGAAEAGNKIRKLEYLFADALNPRRSEGPATVVLTCGGAQSNHARATALLAARLGLKSTLFLRTPDPAAPPPSQGNLLLDRLAGADVRFITPADYQRRDEVMAHAALELRAAGEAPYVIPEGGSNGLGAHGYVHAMQEVQEQLAAGLAGSVRGFDAVVHACGSGGTAAGVAVGARVSRLADTALAMAVCDDRATFEGIIQRIVSEVFALSPALAGTAPFEVLDEYRGPAYAVASPEQREFIVRVARVSGLIFDPVYSGKALFGLAQLKNKPRRALFLHTGGLPGLLAQADELAAAAEHT
jgi:D-cysteine desulfhydrase